MSDKLLLTQDMVASNDILNPFIHHLELTTTYDKIRTGFFTIVILPIRLFAIAGLLILAWLLACIGLYGLTQEDLIKHPIVGWRRSVKNIACVITRLIGVVAGFHYIPHKGKRATRNEAPILVMAPHSSFVDALAVVVMGVPAFVSGIENAKMPFLGKWICILGRSAYYAGGMHIKVKGKQAPRAEAPILVIAPHSTFLDAAIVYVTGFPSIIIRRESGMNPWLGKLINFTQPVYVGRDDPNSRQKTILDIINRTTSKEDWPQVLIFPEGTCTNRSCLITFKPGAFYPGVPVQPVLIRYPNKLDTVTWTWDGPGALKLMWLTLTRAHSRCEIEFLPVYTPNEDEKKDPKLFAHNVRNLMAISLGVPTSEYTYEDCRLVKKAKELQLSQSSQLIQTQKLRSRLGLTRRKVEDQIIAERKNIFTNTADILLSKQEFAKILGVQESEHELEELFKMYSVNQNIEALLSLKKYLLAVLMTNKSCSRDHMVQVAFDCFEGKLNKEWFRYVLMLVYFLSYYHSENIFCDISKGNSTITYDDYTSYVKTNAEIFAENNNSNNTKKKQN